MGHAIQNSRALLNALHDQERTLEMVHCCVGPFNTTTDKDGNNCAILIGMFLADIYLISDFKIYLPILFGDKVIIPRM